MIRTLLSGKIHRATVTGADLDYVGSITVDPELLRAAGILEHERVQVVDVTNGARLETYAIAGKPGEGTVQLNGAAAHLVRPGDLVIVMAYARFDEDEARAWRPRVVLVDERNRIVEVRRGVEGGRFPAPAAALS
ncbi:MAG: aspartate 1-decarboxylase [Thermoanaerobaculia bacterium]|nr:aspartate 1-decarboxylase [Thermoanaerobaculia bacterium]